MVFKSKFKSIEKERLYSLKSITFWFYVPKNLSADFMHE
ncbi:hypothetical protein C5167_046165 [Papaver somniferum]|uniref:Uncharacterized protein n=1 Tax=Papaver somniferum TaxID=3469 RepID=A0A4Y7LGV3_PAPSO|nr:hypothetical protein C5167_046165 [Papaver somniferum]